MTEAKCAVCEREGSPQRKTWRYCSATCRQQARRKKRALHPTGPSAPNKNPARAVELAFEEALRGVLEKQHNDRDRAFLRVLSPQLLSKALAALDELQRFAPQPTAPVMMTQEEAFSVLGLPPGATREEVETKYEALSFEYSAARYPRWTEYREQLHRAIEAARHFVA